MVRNLNNPKKYFFAGVTYEDLFDNSSNKFYDYSFYAKKISMKPRHLQQNIVPLLGLTNFGTHKIVKHSELYDLSKSASCSVDKHKIERIGLCSMILVGDKSDVLINPIAFPLQEKLNLSSMHPRREHIIKNLFKYFYYKKHLNIINNPLPTDEKELMYGIKDMELNFYEKYDNKALLAVPEIFHSKIAYGLEKYNIEIFNDNDYKERDEVFKRVFEYAKKHFGVQVDR
jgi:hypothetical protein